MTDKLCPRCGFDLEKPKSKLTPQELRLQKELVEMFELEEQTN